MSDYLTSIAIAFFALCWFYGIAWFITRGWRDVSKHYKLNGIYTGKKYYFRSGSFAGAKLGCFLILGGNRQGAYLSTIMPRHLCPPLLIPWNDIVGVEHRGLISRKIELTLANDYKKSEVYNYISRNMADKLESLSEGQWSYKHATKRVIFGKDEYR
jgi:hypothetical protein